MNNLYFMGDVWLPQAFQSNIDIDGNFIFNLESPITESENPYKEKICLKAGPDYISETFGINPIAVCLANNHIFDFGKQGVLDTQIILNKNNISFFGCGSERSNYNNPIVISCNGQKVALLGYVCPSTNPISIVQDYGVRLVDLKKIKKDIDQSIKNNADHIIVNIHWGTEEVNYPKPDDIITARKIIDMGADIIIGHHAHCTQPYEVYKGRYIFYGLGNCIMPDIDTSSLYNIDKTNSIKFVKIQNRWNKQSLIVKYDLLNRKVQTIKSFFDGIVLRPLSIKKNEYRLKQNSLAYHSNKYKNAYLYCIIKKHLFDYYNQPKSPRIKHIKTLLSLFTNRFAR